MSSSTGTKNRSYWTFGREEDKELFRSLLRWADVFIQNLKPGVLAKPELASDPRFINNVARVKNRADTDSSVAAFFRTLSAKDAVRRLSAADIAFAVINDMEGLKSHPHLRRIEVGTPSGPASFPAPAPRWEGANGSFGPVPKLGDHSESAQREFYAL